MAHGDRPWLTDDGLIDEADRARGAHVGNLPAGSVYTTVIEGATEGSLWLAQAGGATDVVLHFHDGRVDRIEAAAGAEGLRAMFDRHSGEPRRVSHIGLGLNPYLGAPIGWTLVDEQARGCLLICFGENRYLGGENTSSLNVDFALPGATLVVDGRAIVSEGKLVC
jgi:leucyl aminopeptidase (aminopeptidase T)